MEKTVLILDADPVSRTALEKILLKEGLGELCGVVPPDRGEKAAHCICLTEPGIAPPASKNHINFTKPVRIGAVLEQVKKALAKVGAGDELVTFGAYILNGLNHELVDQKTGKTIRLTEKEGQILSLLAGSGGRVVTRRELLDSVWRYAEGIETHTLETHIYRLRQKIEVDPASPAILLTEETGYRLGKL